MVVLFHIPSFELCIHLNSCKCTVFKIWRNHKTRTFFRLLHSHKMHLSALLAFYTDWNDMFSYPFYLYQLVKSPPFHIPEAWERCPFRTEPPSVILLPLHTASPMHKNPKRCKIIHGMRPMGAKIDRSIWMCVFVEISCLHNFCGSSYFFSSLLCFKIEGLSFNFSILCNTEWWSDLESVFRFTVWLYKGPSIFNFGLALSYGCASKAMDLPFRTNRKRAQTCDRGPGIDTQLVAEYVQGRTQAQFK